MRSITHSLCTKHMHINGLGIHNIQGENKPPVNKRDGIDLYESADIKICNQVHGRDSINVRSNY